MGRIVTIAEFLVARIAEDEAEVAQWLQAEVSTHMQSQLPSDRLVTLLSERMARETDAKRRIVELHAAHEEHECPAWWDYSDREVDAFNPKTGYGQDCQTLQMLAAVYADHPDYRAAEWDLP